MGNPTGLPIEEDQYYARIQNLRLFDDNFASLVLDNRIDLIQKIARTILNRADINIVEAISQLEYKSTHGKSVRFDVFTSDDQNRIFDFEIQRANSNDLCLRIRFNSAMIDTKCLKSGEKYGQLPEAYIIFILENNKEVFANGKAVRTAQSRYDDDYSVVGDRKMQVFVNGAYPDDGSEIAKLMHDFRCADPDQMYDKDFAQAMRYYKKEGGYKKVCQQFEEVKLEQIEKTVLKLYQRGENDINAMVDITDFSVEVVQDILNKHHIVLKPAPKPN